jgi:hypothetical protein
MSNYIKMTVLYDDEYVLEVLFEEDDEESIQAFYEQFDDDGYEFMIMNLKGELKRENP